MTPAPQKPGGESLLRNEGEGFGNLLGGVFAAAFGLLLGLALLKFGNPVVIKDAAKELFGTPQTKLDWLIYSWPVEIGYWLLLVAAIVGLLVANWKTRVPKIILALPLAWLAWEAIAGMHSIDKRLTHDTVIHFSTCVACFYLGVFSLGPAKHTWPFWTGLLAGYALVLISGFDQHFGGLKQTQQYFELYIRPTLTEPVPDDLIKRMYGNRIFATLFYANTLAGVILMLLPVSVAFIGSLKTQTTAGARWFLIVLATASSLACLFWSGSKGGWLLMLLIGLAAALFLPTRPRIKAGLVCAALILGLAGFFMKYASFFEQGSTSVVARFDYWRGALHAIKENPVFGTGPGTYGLMYRAFNPAAHEKPWVAHNDYLQQASDSGIIGGLLYTALVVVCLVHTLRRCRLQTVPMRLAVWLALLGWAFQSTVEFGLYIPAIAWPAFAFMGWLVCQSPIESTTSCDDGKLSPAK